MELFERAAYYGLNSVLAIYLTTTVADGGRGFDEQSVGFLQGIVYAMTYVLPILGGALADRYGYRRMLIVAFSFLSAGYFAAGYMSTYALVFLALLVMASGAGLFKPIISGTIARTTDESNSAFGFGIYYWMINVGAFLAPLIVSVLKGFSWRYVFIASACYTGLMLLPALFVFTEPPRPENTRKLKDVLVGAIEVLGDARFMLMIVVYSGFWILYFQQFGTILYYMRDFVDRTPVSLALTSALRAVGLPWTFTFDAEHVTVIDAGMIILLQVVVSRVVKDRPALGTMVVGMLIGAVGFLCLAFSQSAWMLVAGIAIFAIGEMTAHPKYYSFVGLVAPPDRKAVYMGYAFLYGVFGSLLGANIGASLYTLLMKPAINTPHAASSAMTFWLIFVAIDVVAAIGLIVVARRLGEDTAETRRVARSAMFVVYLLLAALGLYFFYAAYQSAVTQQASNGGSLIYLVLSNKTAIQALIFVALGCGGLAMNSRRR